MTASTTEAIGVGTVLTMREQYDALPVGARLLSKKRGTTWVKEAADVFRSSSDQVRHPTHMSMTGDLSVETLPPDLTATGEPVEGTEITVFPPTLNQFKQRFETIMWGGTQHAGVSSNSNDWAMQRLECVSPPVITKGMVVCRADYRVWQLLPTGTVARNGINPLDPRYAVARVRRQALEIVLGQDDGDTFNCWEVIEVPGVTEVAPYITEEWTPDQYQAVQDWKRRAWEVGQEVRERQGWCETFDSYMNRAGVVRADREERRTYLTAEQVADLPAGSVILYRVPQGSAFLVRDDNYTNPAKTRHLAGLAGDWARAGLEHASGANARNLSIQVSSPAEMDSMPAGTVVREGSGGYRYEKVEDGRWRDASGGGASRYRPEQFSTMNMRYTRIGY